ncbi:hypothetical protein D9M73_262210 [compost metagenome]
MILRNLPEGRVGGGDDGDHLGQGRGGHFGAAECPRHGDAPQAAVGEEIDHLVGNLTGAITLGGTFEQEGSDAMSHLDGLGIGADQVGVGTGDFVVCGFGQLRHRLRDL